jgi:hypothetical protein
MKPLRLERLSPTVMIGIYPDVPVKITFSEPIEGLVFGMEDEGIALRYLPGTSGATSSNTGDVIDSENPTWLTPQEIAALKRSQPAVQPPLIVTGQGGIVEALQSKYSGTPPTLSPASFAVAMVRVPEQMLFEPVTGGAQ